MEIRTLVKTEIDLIRNIDRSEHITSQYEFDNGGLTLKEVDIKVSGFDSIDLDNLIKNQKVILDANGRVFGAFADSDLIGVCSVDSRLFGEQNEYAKLDIMYIDAVHQGKGIAKNLVQKAILYAKSIGAKKLYISATPTKRTVDFYLHIGASLISQPNKKLFELEPEDIHMELMVN